MSFISNFIEEISKMESKAIEETYPPFLTGRGEVILAGILILEEFMQLTGRDELVISTGGIRHGMLFK
jgi:exopolyphosphatase/guanosine-5'-triphosphate,3'-diphosphate pyrophosphatase